MRNKTSRVSHAMIRACCKILTKTDVLLQHTGWTTEKFWFDSRQTRPISVFSKSSRPALAPTQPLIQNGPAVPSPGEGLRS